MHKISTEPDIWDAAVPDPRMLADNVLWVVAIGTCQIVALDDEEWRFAICYDPDTHKDHELERQLLNLELSGWRAPGGGRFGLKALSFEPWYWDEALADGSPNERLIVLLNPFIYQPRLRFDFDVNRGEH